MDTPLAAAVHKENVNVGGGKTTTMRKPKLKPAGKARKALEDLRDTYAPSSGVSNDVDLKPMAHGKQKIAGVDLFTTKKKIVNRASNVANLNTHSVYVGEGKITTTRKPIKSKPAGKVFKALDLRDTYVPSSSLSNDVDLKPMAHGKQQIAGADLFTTKKKIVNRASKVANLKTNSASLGILSDEEIKQCHEWAKEGIEEMGGYSWSREDEENLYKNQTLSETIASAIGVSVSELEQPILSDGEGYVIDDSDLLSPMFFPGSLSPFYTPEELDDLLADEYPAPELKLEDDFNLDNDNRIDERVACALLAELEKTFWNKISAEE